MRWMIFFILLMGLIGCDGVLVGEDDTESDGTTTESDTLDSSTESGIDSNTEVYLEDSSSAFELDSGIDSNTEVYLEDSSSAFELDSGIDSTTEVYLEDSSSAFELDSGVDSNSETETDTAEEIPSTDSDMGPISGEIGTRCPTAGYCDVDLECRMDFFYERRVCTRACDMANDDCPGETVCVDQIPDYDGGVIGPYCLRPCNYQADCETILGSDCDTIDGLLGRFCF
ncbi:MAG: hypothetical protein JXR76_26765 [Deltaproteobacteria bacterium]|nr:hypothetical protein [Deltaproteobacteria bacterium]